MHVEGVEPNRIPHPARAVNKVDDHGRVRPDSRPEQPREDRLALSDRAKELRDALRIVRAAPDVREARVAALQQRIAQGEYKVSAETLARDILGGE